MSPASRTVVTVRIRLRFIVEKWPSSLGENLYGLSLVADREWPALRSPSMTPELSRNEHNSEQRPCPRCGKDLLGCTPRLERDWDGNPEFVDVYFCLSHGFFTFRPSRGLQARF